MTRKWTVRFTGWIELVDENSGSWAPFEPQWFEIIAEDIDTARAWFVEHIMPGGEAQFDAMMGEARLAIALREMGGFVADSEEAEHERTG